MDEAAFRELISGAKTGLFPSIARGGLSGLAFAYGLAVRGRNLAFDRGWLRSERAAAPVVSVGNITTGGTGKTPFVALLVRWFSQRGVQPTILSRGYRALPGRANDEKLLLDELCPGVSHVQNPNRVQSARAACGDNGAHLLILDDGFQHRHLARDLDIVLIDGLNPWGYGRLLPRGLLREPLSSLRRAGLVVLTRVDQCAAHDKQDIVQRLAEIRGTSQHVEVANPAECLVNRAGETMPLESLRNQRVTAFCGIGNPHAFQRTLEAAGLDLGPFTAFTDHHHYSAADLDALAIQAAEHQANAVLMTHKDLVKIERADLRGVPLWALRVGTEIVGGRELLERHLGVVLGSV